MLRIRLLFPFPVEPHTKMWWLRAFCPSIPTGTSSMFSPVLNFPRSREFFGEIRNETSSFVIALTSLKNFGSSLLAFGFSFFIVARFFSRARM